MNKVLVVWEEVPESTSFVILNVSPSDLEKLREMNCHFVNEGSSMDNKILEYFYNRDDDFKFPKSNTPIVNTHFDLVIITGFIL